MSHSIAVFDFDHTITDRDSLLPFLFYVRGFWKTIYHLFALIPFFILYLLGILSRQRMKEKILTHFIGGLSWSELQVLGQQYADYQLDRYLMPKAIQRLKWHQSQGHRCILASASLDFYLKPWAKRHGFEEVLASRLELNAKGEVTGRLLGLNCWGPEKEKRLLAYLRLDPLQDCQAKLYVYGDSRGDREILALADYPFYRKLED